MNDLEKKIWDMTYPICDRNNIELVEVNFKKEFGEFILEILIDKEDYVSTDDTTLVSDKLNILLDEADLISTAYTLEVSSVGLERPLKNDEAIQKSIGKYVHIDLKDYITIGKMKINTFEGVLMSFNNGLLIIQTMNKTRKIDIEINKSNIKFIRLAVKF